MSRSGYSDDLGSEDPLAFGRWRGAVRSAINGKRGQSFLREMLAALDALPAKRLVANDLECGVEVCAIGAVGKARKVDMKKIDPEDRERVAGVFGISPALAAEIVFENDEAYYGAPETPEHRFERMRKWIVAQIVKEESDAEANIEA